MSSEKPASGSLQVPTYYCRLVRLSFPLVVFVCCQISRLITFFVVISRNRISADHASTRVARCSAVSPHIMTRLGLYLCRNSRSCACTYESWVQKPKKAGHLFSSTLLGQFFKSSERTEVTYWTESTKKRYNFRWLIGFQIINCSSDVFMLDFVLVAVHADVSQVQYRIHFMIIISRNIHSFP